MNPEYRNYKAEIRHFAGYGRYVKPRMTGDRPVFGNLAASDQLDERSPLRGDSSRTDAEQFVKLQELRIEF